MMLFVLSIFVVGMLLLMLMIVMVLGMVLFSLCSFVVVVFFCDCDILVVFFFLVFCCVCLGGKICLMGIMVWFGDIYVFRILLRFILCFGFFDIVMVVMLSVLDDVGW